MWLATVLALAIAAAEDGSGWKRAAVGLRALVCCVTAIVAASWAMRWIHG